MFMFRPRATRLLLAIVLIAPLGALRADAQEDSEVPLGDVARNLRKKTPQVKPVIDDDNLPQVMQEAERHDNSGSALRFLMSGNNRGFQLSAPDVTCSLSFNVNAKSLLVGQYDQMDLPPAEMMKVEGKATVEGDALTIPIFNGTQWHLSELAVAFTLLRKARASVEKVGQDRSITDPVALFGDTETDAFQQVRPEKKPDVTVIYRMRASALPWSNAVFSAPLNMELTPGEEWHWAIVQVKGYPPETYVSSGKALATAPARQDPVPSTVSLKPTGTENTNSIAEEPHQ